MDEQMPTAQKAQTLADPDENWVGPWTSRADSE